MRHVLTLCAALALALMLVPAAAEVRIGEGVRIGGNPVPPQTFTKQRRGEYIIHEDKPANEGCRWRKNRDGSRTQVCELQRKK